jgi:phosphoadenosine phosphosulfate reductase
MFTNLIQLKLALDSATPQEIIRWAKYRFFPKVVISSSFQTQSLPLLLMISSCAPEIKVLFIDTGFHFPETIRFRDEVVDRQKLNLEIIKPEKTTKEFQEENGDLYIRQADTCCQINKTIPFQKTLAGKSAWISGIRRDQTTNRNKIPIISQHPFLPLYKISPLAAWNSKEVDAYTMEHNLPTHPLHQTGFLSIGCAPCTTPVNGNEEERAGRWRGIDKVECGIHFP